MLYLWKVRVSTDLMQNCSFSLNSELHQLDQKLEYIFNFSVIPDCLLFWAFISNKNVDWVQLYTSNSKKLLYNEERYERSSGNTLRTSCFKSWILSQVVRYCHTVFSHWWSSKLPPQWLTGMGDNLSRRRSDLKAKLLWPIGRWQNLSASISTRR